MGLGRRWRKRYRPALRALRDQFAIRAVCDARHDRAAREARRFRCRATGVVELLECRDVAVMLLLDAAWHGLWPLELACRFGKPVFCAVPLGADLEHAEAVCRKVSQAQLPVMTVLGPRLAAATIRLRQLLEEKLGAPRLLLCEQHGPRPGRIGVALLDWCMQIFDNVPVRTAAYGDGTGACEDLLADFGDGRSARIRRWSSPRLRPATQLRVVAERGTALVELPNRLTWHDAEGRHAFTAYSSRLAAEMLLEQFYRAVTTGQPMLPGLDVACKALTWLHIARQASGLRLPK